MHDEYVQSGKITFPLKGKLPLVKGWQKLGFSAEPIKGNFGWQLQPTDLVVDVDPRNGGDKSLAILQHELEIDFLNSGFAIALSGRGDGGAHYIMRKPTHLSIRKKLKDYPGIEFLTSGCFVVGVGSIHPSTGRPYTWHWNSEELNDAAEAPERLVKWLTRRTDVFRDGLEDFNNSVLAAKRFISYLATAPISIEGAGGDGTAYAIACVGKDYGLHPELTFTAMLREWNPRCIPPWTDHELRTKIRHAYLYAQEPLGSKDAACIFTDRTTPLTEVIEAPELNPMEVEEQTQALVPYDPKDAAFNASRIFNSVLGGAERFVHCSSGYWRYSPEVRHWYLLDKQEIKNMIQTILRPAGCTQNVIQQSIQGTLNYAPHLTTELQPTERIIGLENTVLRVTDREVKYLYHSPAHNLTSLLDIRTTDSPATKHWQEFLQSVFGDDEELKALLQEWMGYCLVPGNWMQKIGLFVGQSRAGKGVISRVLQRITSTAGASLRGLCGDFGLSHLPGKNLAIIGDAHNSIAGQRDKVLDVLLSISGEDVVDVNRKHCPILSMTLATKLLLIANEMPTWFDSSNALINRYVIIPFSKTFAGREDMLLERQLKKESYGILLWALEGLQRLLCSNRFTKSETSVEALKSLEIRSNPVKTFLDYAAESVPGAVTNGKMVWEHFVTWCVMHDVQPCGLAAFHQRAVLAMPGVIAVPQASGSVNLKNMRIKELPI